MDQRMPQAFTQVIKELMRAPALGFPDPTRPFTFFVHEWKGIAAGVLTQKLGSWQKPVAYFSKQTNGVALEGLSGRGMCAG